MSLSNEARRLSIEVAAAADAWSGRESAYHPLGSPSLVARTKAVGTYPTAAARFYALEPLVILGAEVEGSAGVVTPSGSTFVAYNLGSAVPPQSTAVIATFVNHRWVFRYDG